MSAPVDCEPLVALLPVQAPEAVLLVAFVLLHVSIELLPLETAVGFAVRLTVGAGLAADTVTVVDRELLPPVPVQDSV